MNNSELVSIIIPTHNRAILLQEALNSVAAQTYRPVECIIVDDGSTDNTKEVVENFITQNNEQFRVQYIHQQNSGAQTARNTGTAAASGDFIQYLDSDDLLYPDKIKTQVNFLNNHPGCDAVFGDWDRGLPDKKTKVVAYKSENLISQILSKDPIHTLAILMRKKLVNQIGQWDTSIKRNQEIDFHLRGILAGGHFEYLPGNCGLWRTHGDERIANSTGLKEILFAYGKWEKLLIKKNLFEPSLQKKIAGLYMWFLTQYEKSPKEDLLKLVKEIARLDPGIEFYNNKKLVLLRKTIGENAALKMWLKRYYKIGDGQSSAKKTTIAHGK